MTKLNTLRAEIHKFEIPKTGIQIVNGIIGGTGFFPAADGMIGENRSLETRSIMFLGQDQDSVENFQETIEKDREDYSPTWNNLKKLLVEVNIPQEECFFTNCIIGLRAGKMNTGKAPIFKDKAFLRQCEDFLALQIATVRPKAIFCLGKVPFQFLSRLNSKLNQKLRGKDSFRKIDAAGLSVVQQLEFDSIPNLKSNVAVLVHPSLRWSNVRHRTYGNLMKHEAELAMIHDALHKKSPIH
ncbi:MAG: uracil-DNA glycosylase family protein [Bacteroidota bacterium]